MFYRDESLIEQALIVKLSTFQSRLENRKKAYKHDVHAYFLLEVLNETLQQVPELTRLIFPLNGDDAKEMHAILYHDRYEVLFLADNAAEKGYTSDELFRQSPWYSSGIGLYKNNLYEVVLYPNGTVQLSALLADVHRDIAQKSVFKNTHMEPGLSSRRDANLVERNWIIDVLNLPNGQQNRLEDLMVIIELIKKIEEKLETKYKTTRSSALTKAGAIVLMAGLVKLSAVDTVLLSATITTGMYFVAGVLALVTFYYLGLALYAYFNEKHWFEQLSKFHAIANQTKTYDFEASISNLENDMPETKVSASIGTLKTVVSVGSDESRVRITTQYPTLRTLFAHHQEKLRAIEPSLRLTYR